MLKQLTLSGFKSFGKKTQLDFTSQVTAIVGPNGSGKSNVADAFRWVLGEQSFKSIRGKRGEDFIYHGSQKLSRASTAQVSVVFDNRNRRFNIDYDEVVISRKVHRDGQNEYAINKSKVRLRDIIELLASVGVGATSHHIISQGEADRFLLAKPDERRVMIEDALGIKIYQYKKQESERKLQKTESNIKEVESLRRELAPHIKYLKKQVDKIEQAKRVQEELLELYKQYLKDEEHDIEVSHSRLTGERAPLLVRKKELTGKIQEVEGVVAKSENTQLKENEDRIQSLQASIRSLNTKKDEIYRSLGRIEGAMGALERANTTDKKSDVARVLISDIKDLKSTISQLINDARSQKEVERVRSVLEHIGDVVEHFSTRFTSKNNEVNVDDRAEELTSLKKEAEDYELSLAELTRDISTQEQELQKLLAELEKSKDAHRDARLQLVSLRGEHSEVEGSIRYIDRELSLLLEREARFKQELGEANVIVGREVMQYVELSLSEHVNRHEHEARLRKIERMKIRLDDLGGDSESTLKEFEQITERDQHLAQELADLTTSAEKLKQLIDELTKKLDTEFQEGIKHINKEFARFFSLLFGGGGAKLRLVQPELSEEEQELGIVAKEGVDVEVDMPKKRVRSLQMLSGGERALTSLSLLFAIAHVNPPPFMILDETDAALDEVNSRKYGDMIEELAKDSQLIIITHNRETMAHAGALYGVTMGSEGVSRVLSIQFEEAGDVLT